MPNSGSKPQQQFEAVEELIPRWLKERRSVLGKYTEIVVALDLPNQEEALQKRQRELCQLLVDYVSVGHFEVFHELIEEAESFADGSSDLAEKVMPAIGDTTEIILAYQEKYCDSEGYEEKLKRDLSSLGEVLESRFLLEDKLIAGLHNRHRRVATGHAQESV
jgi:regulator of sigma D